MLRKMPSGEAPPAKKQLIQAPSTPSAMKSVMRKSPQARVSELPIQK